LGLACLLTGRDTLFAVLIALSAAFKLTPALFLLTTFLVDRPHRWRPVAIGMGTLALWVGLNYWSDPVEFAGYISGATSLQESAAQGNPSHLRFWWDLLALVAKQTGQFIPTHVPWLLFGATAISIVWFSYRSWVKSTASRIGARELESIFLFCTTYALIQPRFKSYSYILLLPPAYYVLMRGQHVPATGALLALFASSAVMPLPNPVPLGPYFVLLWLFYPLLLAFTVWGLLLRFASDSAAGRRKPSPST
jgi:hypothetical protein